MVKQENDLKPRKFKFNGIFDYNGMMGLIKGFYGARNYDLIEKGHKVKAFTEGMRKEITLYFDKDTTEYINYNVTVEIKIHNLFEIEVVKKGKKQKLQQARMWIELKPVVVYDYREIFPKDTWLEKAQQFYETKIMKNEKMYHWERILNMEADKLFRELKTFLGMESS